jgi:hypothetical protein
MKKEKPKKKVVKADAKTDITYTDFAFGKENYKWLLVALAFLLVGFILMIGGGSDDPKIFNYGMFNFQRLTLSPVFLFIGYLLGIYAIMKKPKDTH